MLFAQFFQKSAISAQLIEACGDRSVVILDGRYSNNNNAEIAASECKKRGYLAWAIYRGETFTRSNRVSGPWYVSNDIKDKTAMSATYGF